MSLEDFDFSSPWEAILSFFGVSALTATCRTILSPEKRSLRELCIGVPLSLLAGCIVGLFIWDLSVVGKTMKCGIIVLASYVAPYFLTAITKIASELSKKPIKTIVDAILRR